MLALLVTLAFADDATCTACCKAGGLESCPTKLQIRTEKSGTDAVGLDWELQGAWILSCDGTGRFDPTFTTSADHEPEYGEVLGSGANPLAVHCFVEACALPAGVCLGPANLNGDVHLIGCDDALPVDQKELAHAPAREPGAEAMVVVIDGRPIVAERTEGGPVVMAAPASPAAPAPAVAAPASIGGAGANPAWGAAPSASSSPSSSPSPSAAATAWTGSPSGYSPPPAWEPAPGSQASTVPSYSPAPAYPAPAAPTTPAYGTPAPAYGSPPFASGAPAPAYGAPLAAAPEAPPVLELPPDPPDPCADAMDAVRGESRKRVGSGDDFRIAGKPAEALRDYRAALTMDKCNGYAWMSIAQIATDQGRTDLSVRALRNTTRLLPAHPGGWMMLGKAYESIGQRTLAADAYRKATELAPGNAEAVEGYMRTR